MKKTLGVDLSQLCTLVVDKKAVNIDESSNNHLDCALLVALDEGLNELNHLNLRMKVLALIEHYRIKLKSVLMKSKAPQLSPMCGTARQRRVSWLSKGRVFVRVLTVERIEG